RPPWTVSRSMHALDGSSFIRDGQARQPRWTHTRCAFSLLTGIHAFLPVAAIVVQSPPSDQREALFTACRLLSDELRDSSCGNLLDQHLPQQGRLCERRFAYEANAYQIVTVVSVAGCAHFRLCHYN